MFLSLCPINESAESRDGRVFTVAQTPGKRWILSGFIATGIGQVDVTGTSPAREEARIASRVYIACCRRLPVLIQGFTYLFFLHDHLPCGMKPGPPPRARGPWGLGALRFRTPRRCRYLRCVMGEDEVAGLGLIVAGEAGFH